MSEIKEAIEVLSRYAATCAEGDHHIVVLDRGFIFAGRLSKDPSGETFTLSDAVNVRKWAQGGFGGLTLSAKDSGAVLDRCAAIRFHRSAMMFAVPITEAWYGRA